MKVRRAWSIIFFQPIVFALLLPSNLVYSLEQQAEAPKTTDHTFMVYMIPSNLESDGYLATADLNEMIAVGSTPQVNIIVQTGGAANATIDKERFIDFTKVQRHVVLKDKIKTVQDLGEQNMATSESLSGFIQWGLLNYPANAYSIILWDHGAGLLGFGYDDIYNDILTPTELQDGFKPIKNIGKKFDVIGFDACLMASIEIASRLSSAGNYLVASQELVPSWGWNYTAVLASLKEDPKQDGKTLGKVIADSFMSSSRQSSNQFGPNFNVDRLITMSVIDLAKVPALVTSTDKLGTTLTRYIDDLEDAYGLARAIQATERYGEGGTFSTGQLDLYDFADNIDNQFPELAGAGSTTKSLIKEAVVYSVNGDLKGDSHGVSIFMQIQDYESNAPYLRYIVGEWIALLENARGQLQKDVTPPTIDLYMDDGQTIKGYISSQDLAGVPLFVLEQSPFSDDKSKMIILSIESKEPSDIVRTDGTVNYQWGQSIPSLCNNASSNTDCKPTLIFLDNIGMTRYAFIPVRIESERFSGELTLLYTVSSAGKFEFLGGWPGVDEHGNAVKDMIPILKGDKVFTFSYEIDYDNDYHFNVIEQDPIAVTSDQFGPTYHRYPGEYDLIISGCDFAGNCAYSPEFEFTVE